MNSSNLIRTSSLVAGLFSSALCLSPVAAQGVNPPSCYPLGLKGESYFRADFFKRTTNGWILFWYCKQPDGSWTSNGRYCRHGQCVQGDWLAGEIEVGQATDRGAATAAVDARLTVGPVCTDEIAANTANAPVCKDLIAEMQNDANKPTTQVPPPAPTPAPAPAPTPAPTPAPPPPPPAAYIVARSFLANGTRAIYPVVSGKVSDVPVPGVTALPGEPCDATVTITKLGLTYMSVRGNPAWVAVCIKGP